MPGPGEPIWVPILDKAEVAAHFIDVAFQTIQALKSLLSEIYMHVFYTHL